MKKIVTLLLVLFPLVGFGQNLFVANQGNFSDGNGSILNYNLGTSAGSLILEDFGSIVQSIYIAGDSLYVMQNTGNRIDVYDLISKQQTAQITGFTSPRYMIKLDDTLAVASNLYPYSGAFSGGDINFFNIKTGDFIDSVAVGSNPEGLLAVNGQVLVANFGFGSDSTVSVIDIATKSIADTLNMGCDGPRLLFADRQGDIWVTCAGKTLYDDQFNVIGNTPGEVLILNGTSYEEITRFTFTEKISTTGPGQDAFYNDATQELYVVRAGTDIVRFNTATHVISDTLTFEGDEIGAVTTNGAGDQIYVAHIPGFTSGGRVSIHNHDGSETGHFLTGVAPSHLLLYGETDVANEFVADLPNGFELGENYPNPFNPTTTIPFALQESAFVTLTIYNALGQKIATLLKENRPAGEFTATWNAESQASGLYYYRLTVGTKTQTNIMILLK